jgi:hypothetical protein
MMLTRGVSQVSEIVDKILVVIKEAKEWAKPDPLFFASIL